MPTETIFVVPLPDGGCAAFDTATLAAARARAGELGFAPKAASASSASSDGERWLTSEELAAITRIGATKWEAMARRGEVPCIRCGRALRFRESDVRAAMQARA